MVAGKSAEELEEKVQLVMDLGRKLWGQHKEILTYTGYNSAHFDGVWSLRVVGFKRCRSFADGVVIEAVAVQCSI